MNDFYIRDLYYSYGGYEITKLNFLLDEEEIKCIEACIFMVENKTSIRATAKNCCYRKSTFHRRIHSMCRDLSPELYEVVKRQMKENLKKRGCRRNWKKRSLTF